jgi:uncharacterized iron-regulated protein
MEITAIQKLIQYLHENKHFDVIPVAKELLEKEKEQIIDASKHSYIAGYLDNQCKVDESMNFPEEYYNQTYNDITRTNSNI